MHPYSTIVKSLPTPSWEQTGRFARFAMSARSWYKHLPVQTKVPFVFFLDPGSGMSHIRTPTGEVALLEITDASTRFHYTWQTTATYRQRFGFWRYFANDGTCLAMITPARDHIQGTPGSSSVQILSETGDWIDVPAELAGQGTANVSALIHPNPTLESWMGNPARYGLPELPRTDNSLINRILDRPQARYERLLSLLEQDRAAAPQLVRLDELLGDGVKESIRSLIPRKFPDLFVEQDSQLAADALGWLFTTEKDYWDWPDAAWRQQIQALGVEDKLLDSALAYAELECQRSQFRFYRERMTWGPRDVTKATQAALHEAVALEHATQFEAMLLAMSRFTVAVYGAHA